MKKIVLALLFVALAATTAFAEERTYTVEDPFEDGREDTYARIWPFLANDNVYDSASLLVGNYLGCIFTSYWRWQLEDIPARATIRKAYVVVYPRWAGVQDDPMRVRFKALKPDGFWDQPDAFLPYLYGDWLNNIPRMGWQVDWYIADSWNYNVQVKSPDISNLVQRRVSDGDYVQGDYFGLACYMVDDYNPQDNIAVRWTWQSPCVDCSQPYAELHVEWDDVGEAKPSENPIYPAQTDFKIEQQEDDTWSVWGPGINGNYWKGNEQMYTLPNCQGQENGIGIDFHQTFGDVPSHAYWRWNLSDGETTNPSPPELTADADIPRGAEIEKAYMTVNCKVDSHFSGAHAMLALLKPGENPESRFWDGPDGFESYGCYLTETQIPIVWWDSWGIPPWFADDGGAHTGEYTIPNDPEVEPDLSGFVQAIVNAVWDDEYDFFSGWLLGRHYEYLDAIENIYTGPDFICPADNNGQDECYYVDSLDPELEIELMEKGDYLGITAKTGGYERTVWQDPEDDPGYSPEERDDHDDHYPARLHVEWTPHDYYYTTYRLGQAQLEPEIDDTYTKPQNPPADSNIVSGDLEVGRDENGVMQKGYWRWGLSIPQYALIQKATLVYDLEGPVPELYRPKFHALIPPKWSGSGGFKDVIVRDSGGGVPDLDHYPDAASLDQILRFQKLGEDEELAVSVIAYDCYGANCNPPPQEIPVKLDGLDVTPLVQRCVDNGYQPGDYFGLVLDDAGMGPNGLGLLTDVPEGSLKLYVEWIEEL